MTSWQLEPIESTVPLLYKGQEVTGSEVINQIKGAQGLVLQVGKHTVEFTDQGSSLKLVANGTYTQEFTGTVHLNFNPMALCVGDKCVMWPKQAAPQIPQNQWHIAEVDSALPLSHKGQTITVDQFKSLFSSFSGPLLVQVGKNTLEFENETSFLKLVVNGSYTEKLQGPVHLSFKGMAVCVGDKCVMWPKITAPVEPEPKKKEPEKPTDQEFLASIKSKLGEADFSRLESLLSKSKPAPKKQVHHGPVRHVATQQEFEAKLKEAGSKGVIVDCSAVWCEPCKVIAPHYHQLAEKYQSEIMFLEVDVQENTYVQSHFQVGPLPTFLFIKDGQVVTRIEGSDKDQLTNTVKDFDQGTIKKDEKQEVMEVEKRTHFDYIVIGGGSGGLASAKEAAKHGAHVALFDYVKPSTQNTTWGLGGTCVNVGCVPKKLMHYASLLGEQFQDARAFGWELEDEIQHDWTKLVDTVQAHVKKLNYFYEKGLKTANTKTMRPNQQFPDGETIQISAGTLTYFNALAHFTGPKEVAYVGDLHNHGTVTGDKILIAVGGRPWVPSESEVPGARKYCITSDDLFSLKKSPGKTLCVGAGYIALECGGFLSHLGLDVTVSVRSTPLRTGGFDRQAVDKVVQLMEATGTKFAFKSLVTRVNKRSDGRLDVTLQDVDSKKESIHVFDTVLYATGRGADTEKLGIQVTGVKVSDKGTIFTNESDQTNVPHIWAVGDVAHGRPELTPVAVQAGEMLSRRLFAKATELMDYTNVPTTVFTPWEYGIVGLSEEDALLKYGQDDIEVFLSEFSSLEIGPVHRKTHAGEDLPTNALSKLVCVKSLNYRVVGFHFVGPNAGEITQGFALGVKLKATKKDFDDLVGIHPTDAESFCALGVSKSSGEQWESSGGCGGGKCG